MRNLNIGCPFTYGRPPPTSRRRVFDETAKSARQLTNQAGVEKLAALDAGHHVSVAVLRDLAAIHKGVELIQHHGVGGSRSLLVNDALIDGGALAVLNDQDVIGGLSQSREGEAKSEAGGDERAKHGGSPSIEGGEFLESNS